MNEEGNEEENNENEAPLLLTPRRPRGSNSRLSSSSVVLSSVGSSKDAQPNTLVVNYPECVVPEQLTLMSHASLVMSKGLADQLGPWFEFLAHRLNLLQDDVRFLRTQYQKTRNYLEFYKCYKNSTLDSFKQSWLEMFAAGGSHVVGGNCR
jgi:hypothetical protein